MVVVADTSPINYLTLIEQIEILPQLYTAILIPPSVLEELKHPFTPKIVRDWIGQAPKWIEVRSPKTWPSISQLDRGESEAIALAVEWQAQLLRIDEQAGRQEAVRRGLRVAGTLSVLDEADRAGLLDFEAAIDHLCRTSFRVSRAILSEIRQRRSSL